MRYLVTGGTGFLGQELIKRLLDLDSEVVVLARGEAKMVELIQKFPKIIPVLGDVANPYFCERAMKGCDGVFHLAAVKHIGFAEDNVLQTIYTNIPVALLETIKKQKPQFVVGISTDKAASRKGVYGTTKFLMERLFVEYEKQCPETKFRIVRYGNVLYSTGSVLCKWKEKIQKGEQITITDPDATRFFWTVEQAVDLIFECLIKAEDSTPYVTQMRAIRMGDLMSAMLGKYSQDKISVKVIGLQPGENMHEIIVEGGQSSAEAERYTTEEIAQLI